MKSLLTLAFTLMCCSLWAQSPAGLSRLEAAYSPAAIADMQQKDPGKLQGLVWWYAQSWRVVENGVSREPSAAEVDQIDIKVFDAQRQFDSRVRVSHEATGLQLELLSLDEAMAAAKTFYSTEKWDQIQASYQARKQNAISSTGQKAAQ